MDPEARVAAVMAQVEKEKATSRENLKKAMKASQDKKAVEAQLAQVMEATGGALPPGMSKYMVR